MERMEKFCNVKIDRIGVYGTCYTLGNDIYFNYNDEFFKVDDIMLENSIKCNIMKYFLEEAELNCFEFVGMPEKNYNTILEQHLSALPGWHGDYLVQNEFCYCTIRFMEGSILHVSRDYETGEIILTKIADSIEDFKRVYKR